MGALLDPRHLWKLGRKFMMPEPLRLDFAAEEHVRSSTPARMKRRSFNASEDQPLY
jgi:hypothetical protein